MGKARSGPPPLSSVNTGLFLTTSSDSVNPANGLPAWATPADPLSAPTAVAMMSSALFPSDPAPAPANPAFSPKSPPTDLGSRPSLMEQSKSIFCFFVSYFLLTHLLLMFQLIDEYVWK